MHAHISCVCVCVCVCVCARARARVCVVVCVCAQPQYQARATWEVTDDKHLMIDWAKFGVPLCPALPLSRLCVDALSASVPGMCV
jgi:hypothetical protein